MDLHGNLKNLKYIKTFGSSMLPLLQDGDIVYFHKISLSSIKTFDIVLVNKNKKYVTHRVIYKTQKYLITKGDSNNYSDGKILPQQIVGIVYQIRRRKQIFPVETLSLMQNGSYLQEIEKITKLFHKNKIDFVFLKGLPIYLFYTKEMPKRIYADCDILVAEKDYLQAKKLLMTNGFWQREANNFLSKFLLPHLMEEDFFKIHSNFPITIDLHKRPFSYIRKLDFPDSLYPKKLMDIFTRDLLQTKRWVKINDITIPIPQSDYLLIFLSLHFFTHTMKMVHRLWLIKEVVKKDKKTNKSWDRFLEIVEQYKIGYLVYPAFYFVNSLYGKIVSDWVIKQVKPRKSVEQIYKLKQDLIFDEKVDLSRVFNKLSISWNYSPQPLYRRIGLLFSPSLFLLLITYIQPLGRLFLVEINRTYKKRFRKIISIL